MRRSTATAGTKLALLTLLTSVGVLVCATAATVYTAGRAPRSTRLNPSRQQEPTRQWEPIRALSDSLVAPLAGPRGEFAPLDSATLAAIVALIASPSDSAAWITHSRPDTARGHTMAAYRAWTHAAVLPPFWGLRVDDWASSDVHPTTAPRLQTLKGLWRFNEAEADSALVRGDVRTALLRARENIAGARHLLWQPTPISALVGRVMMAEGAKLLARVAMQADDPSLHSAAERLLTMVRASQFVPNSALYVSPTLEREPGAGKLAALAGDRSLHPATRVLAIEIMVGASCSTIREVLMGPSHARYAAIDSMIESTSDIPHMRDLKPIYRRRLDLYATASHENMKALGIREPVDEEWSDVLVRALVPTSVLARADYCKVMGY